MIKVATDTDLLFEWNAPTPITGGVTLKVYATSTPVTVALTQSRTALTVTAIASDRRTLTLSASATALQADQVKAFFVTNGDTYFSVAISRIVDTTAILAEPLPREVDLSTSGSLEFAMYYGTVTTAQVTDTPGYYPYTVGYTSNLGSQTQGKTEKGIIKVTNRPFDTGLDHDELVRTFANLADMVPRRQSSFEPQIKASLEEIILVIRNHLRADDITEDEVFNPESFKLAHAYCAASRIYEQALQFDAANMMKLRCEELIDKALATISLDLDGDGLVDSGEEVLSRKGGGPSDFRASWRTYSKSANDSFFTPKRGMRH